MGILLELQQLPFGALSAKLAHDLTSPTIKLAGNGLASFAQKGATNVRKVLKRTDSALRLRGKKSGAFSSRVLKEVVQQAYFCENELQGAYLGGILASSKSNSSRDDRAVAYLSILNSLSCYQIRTHALLYSSILRMNPTDFNKGKRWILRGDITVILLEKNYLAAMEFEKNESSEIIVQHVFNGLQQHGLSVNGHSTFMPRRQVVMRGSFFGTSTIPTVGRSEPEEVTEAYRYFWPTALGIELFLWGIGYGDKGLNKYSPDLLKRIKLPVKIYPTHVSYGQTSYG